MTNPLRASTGILFSAIALVGCQSQQNRPASAVGSQATVEEPVVEDNTPPAPGSLPVYIGTFTNKASKGIYLGYLDPKTGKLTSPKLVAEAPSPSFLALHPNHKFIYSVNEVNAFQNHKTGGVSAFAIDPASGKLTAVNQQSSAGTGPTHIWIDPTGKNVLVANYAGGSVAVLPVKDDGSLEPPSSVDQHWGRGFDKGRQEAPHAHSIYTDPNNKFVLACDLGLDKVFVYRFDAGAHTIQPADPYAVNVEPAPSGPRHLAFHTTGKYVYVLNEMACTLTAFTYDADKGELKSFQTIGTLPEGNTDKNKSTAEIFVHPSGKFVYSSNRGNANSITAFKVDPETGKLSVIDHTSTQGRTPRGFGIDPSGQWLLAGNQDSDSVAVYRIDQETGKLTPTGKPVKCPTPVCITFVPNSQGV